MMRNVDPLHAAIFLIVALSLAGLLHASWLRSRWSRPFLIPIDRGLRFRGRRVFGKNKTLRGFMVMVPGSALSFAVLAAVLRSEAMGPLLPWELSTFRYAALGAWAGAGFMLGELPNSFLKRQFGVPPGEAPQGRVAATLTLATDRIDSILGMLIGVSLAVPTPAATWVYMLLLGPLIHGSFSILLFHLGVKARRV